MEKLIIRHFGPVMDLDVNILPLTVFIGTQGCGKSTASKVLTILSAFHKPESLAKTIAFVFLMKLVFELSLYE